MGIDYSGSGWKFPKPEPRALTRRTKRLTNAEKERQCRAETKRLYGTKCVIPGCKEIGEQHHVEYRSRARLRKHDPTNRRPICRGHHQLIHAGKIQVFVNESGELIIQGDRKLLAFKL
jgi:hypothetical protein